MSGIAGRTASMQLNFAEVYTGFAASLIVSTIFKVPLALRVNGSLIFILSRIAYAAFFCLNLPFLRGLAYAIGNLVCLWLYYVSIYG